MASRINHSVLLALAALASGWAAAWWEAHPLVLVPLALAAAWAATRLQQLPPQVVAAQTHGPDVLQLQRALRTALDRFISEVNTELSGVCESSGDGVLRAGEEVARIFQLSQAHLQTVEQVHQRIEAPVDDSALVSEMSSQLTEMRGQAQRQGKTLAEAMNFTTRILQLSGRVGAISQTAKMLSLNARVEAARAGEAGEAFQVVAHEMGELVGRLIEINTGIAELGSRMVHVLPEAEKAAAELAANCDERVERLELLMAAWSENARTLSDGARSAAAASARDAQSIVSGVGNVTVHLQFQDRMAQRVRACMEALSELPQTASEALDAGDGNESPLDRVARVFEARCRVDDADFAAAPSGTAEVELF